jgi:hypothetical protein
VSDGNDINKWTACADRMPPARVPVLAYIPSSSPGGPSAWDYEVIEYDPFVGWGDPLSGYIVDGNMPTHWCAIPDPKGIEQ